MNERERFLKTMRFEEPDRVPYFEQFIRDDVIHRWRKEGLPRRMSVAEYFNLDRRKVLPLKLTCHEMPSFNRLIETENDLNRVRKYLEKALKNAYPRSWEKLVEELKSSDYPVGIGAWESGILQFLGVDGWSSFERACLMLYDNPDLAEQMIELCTRFLIRGVERALEEVKIDFAYFTEPIAGSDGPIISPEMFRRFVVPQYKRVIAPLKEHGVEVIIMRSYGNTEVLLPDMVEAGITGLWMTDMVPSNMDYASIRETYGRKLALIGGIDSRVLAEDEEAIEKEIYSKVPPLLASGGYIPTIDNRARSHIPFKNFVYYRMLLEKICCPPAT